MASPEAVPFAKTGGLADVVGALPKALKRMGIDVGLVLPKYREIDEKKLKPNSIIIDTSKPIINSFTNLINGRRVILTLNITEINFDEVNYIDYNEVRPTTKNLCSSLRKGICSTSKTFRQGNHNITLNVLDKAGNTEQRSLIFNI